MQKLTALGLLSIALAACSSDDGGGQNGPAAGAGGDVGASSGGSGGRGSVGNAGSAGAGGKPKSFAFGSCAAAEVSLTDLSSQPSQVVTITGTSKFARALEGHGKRLYVLSDNALYLVEGDATAVKEIATGITGIPAVRASAGDGMLRVSDTHAYYATIKGISRVELASGKIEVVYEGLANTSSVSGNVPLYVEIDAEFVYFALRDSKQIYRVPNAGGSAQLLNEGLTVQGMGVQGGYVYVADSKSESIHRLPVSGGASERIDPRSTDLAALTHLTVSPSAVYWIDKGNLKTIAFATPGVVTVLGRVANGNLTAAGNRVYWQDESVGWTAADNSGCTTVVHGDFPDDASEYGITDDYVFVFGNDVLLRLPR